MNATEEMNARLKAYEQEIRETCALAGKPERAQALINRQVTGAECRAELLGNRINLAEMMTRLVANGGGDFNAPNI